MNTSSDTRRYYITEHLSFKQTLFWFLIVKISIFLIILPIKINFIENFSVNSVILT